MLRKKTKKSSEVPEKKKISGEEFEKRVIELAKKGFTSEKIGLELSKEGIHPKEHIKISKILKNKNLYVNPDLKNIEKKLNRLREHYEKNKQDKKAMRERERIAAGLRKIRNYFKR